MSLSRLLWYQILYAAAFLNSDLRRFEITILDHVVDRALSKFIGSQTQFHALKKGKKKKPGVHRVKSVQVYRAGLHPQPFAPLIPSDGDRSAAHPAHEYNEHAMIYGRSIGHLFPFISVFLSPR